MTVLLQLLILALLLVVIPVVIGGIFSYVDTMGGSLLFRWISGQFILWAGFQLICVPLILKERSFGQLTLLFLLYTAALLLFAVAAGIRRRALDRKLFPGRRSGSERREKAQAGSILLWAVFWGLLAFQLVQAVRLAYADTDDAYYVAVSSITQSSDTMYQVLPYTGGGTGLDARHGLAPFPVWVAFLGKLSGMHAVTVAQVVLPVVLISMTYGIFYLFGSILFPARDGKQPLFLIFTEILVLFGNYSIYTVENFMIARSRQGKAALGNIVIPFLLLLFLLLLGKLQTKEKISPKLYLLFGAVTVTGCLCSTLGALLVCMAVGVAGILGALCYRRLQVLFPLALCCVPCVCYAVLYLLFD